MKKLIFILSLLFLLQYSGIINAQWTPVKRLTYGYKDSNPDFNAMQNYEYQYPWEFLIFQRQIDTASQICIMRLDKNGPVDSVKYLTSGNFIKRNPCIAYIASGIVDTIRYAFALWESNQNGKWDIYGSYYSQSGGWTQSFPVDSSSENKFGPKAIMLNSDEFGITYTRGNDVIHRKYNAVLKSIISETNLTDTFSAVCKNPIIAYPRYNAMLINFRVEKFDGNYDVYSVQAENGNSWERPRLIASIGNNNTSHISRNYGLSQEVFESERNGKKGIYSFVRIGASSGVTDVVLSSPNFNYYGMKSWLFPHIFADEFVSNVSAVIRKSSDSIKVLFDHQNWGKDSASIGDTSKNVSLALNNGVKNGWDYKFFVVFNMDTASYTSLYYRTRIYVSTGVHYIGNTLADKFALHQNYPNPFNPTTKIKFDIPKLSDIKITVFDAVGREVKNLSQQNLTAGSYEYDFNGANLSSGVYYFTLTSGEFKKTVKMLLMK